VISPGNAIHRPTLRTALRPAPAQAPLPGPAYRVGDRAAKRLPESLLVLLDTSDLGHRGIKRGLAHFNGIDDRQRRLLFERPGPPIPKLRLVVERVQNGGSVAGPSLLAITEPLRVSPPTHSARGGRIDQRSQTAWVGPAKIGSFSGPRPITSSLRLTSRPHWSEIAMLANKAPGSRQECKRQPCP